MKKPSTFAPIKENFLLKKFKGPLIALLIVAQTGFFSFVSAQESTTGNVSFINRLHRKLYHHSKPYTFLYNQLWLVDTAKSDTDLLKKPNFVVIPYFAYSPETSFQFGGAGVYSLFLHKDSITRVSAQTGSISYTLNNQFDLELDPDFWTAYNKTHYTGTIIFASFPLNFYGIGYSTKDSNKVNLDSRKAFIDLEFEKQVIPNFRIGTTLIVTYDNFNLNANKDFLNNYSSLYGAKGGTSFFTGLSFIYDDRDVLNFTSKGTYIRLNPSVSLHGISNLNTMAQVNFTGVEYLKFSHTLSLGLNMIANTIIGKQVPFFLLYQLGGANIERGYYQGRYRDKSILAAQAEFKYHFLARLALCGFVGTGTTWGYQPFSTSEFKPSYGGGIHYIFSIQNQLSLRLDYALGNKPPGEQRFHGVYFAIGEAF